jgi:hypothetical protein
MRNVTGVDHIVILVRDLDASRDAIARLGFTVSPRGLHSAHMGTANYTIMLGEDYFELLGILTPTEANTQWQRALEARGEGPSAIALQTPDARALMAELEAAGIGAPPVLDFARPVELPGGGTGEAAFSIARLAPGATPGVATFACQQRTRETVWIPELMRHANTATGLASLTLAVEDPAAAAAQWGVVFGAGAVTETDETVWIDTGTVPLNLMTPEDARAVFAGVDASFIDRPMLAGIGFEVADAAACAAVLRGNGVAVHEDGEILRVGPEAGCGAVLEFS